MKIKTKTVNVLSSIAIGITIVTLSGCKSVSLPQPPVPELFAETETATQFELVVKHVSLFRQGVTFDILDSNESRDATGVVIEKNHIKVLNDTLIVEKKSKKESIDDFLASINQIAGNCYTIEKISGDTKYEIYKMNGSCNTRGKEGLSQLLYIYNQDMPDMVIRIEQADKNNSPRADLEQTKVRYESIQFL